MSSIVTSILSSTVGLLVNKARDTTAAKLKEGDITDAKIREIVVRELNDVKTKLDGLSRKDLLSSYSFLQEGVDFLNVSLNISKVEQKALVNETQVDRGETSTLASDVQCGILNEALELSHAIGKLNVNSDKEFQLAKERFKDARKRATDAFCIESLSIQDRILAAKLRVVSEILESLESPETAITGCLSFLKKLHSLPAIKEIFTVYLNGGIKSILNKSERAENVKSVMLINYVLFHYVWKFSSRYCCSVFTWPTIQLADRGFRPILEWQEVLTRKSRGNELQIQPPNELLLHGPVLPEYSVVNSHCDVVIKHSSSIKVISKSGEVKAVKLPQPRVIKHYITGLAVDSNDNVYVLRCLETRTENGDVKVYVLYVLDKSYNVKHDWKLGFLQKTSRFWVRIAINKNDNIIMIIDDDPYVYVCDNTGKLKDKFKHDSGSLPSLSISGQDEIMISSKGLEAVRIYSEEGDLKSTIKLPEGHEVCGVTFHYAIGKIIVLTHVEENDSFFLLCYTEAGEMETSKLFGKRTTSEYFPVITSHPSGPVVVVKERSITFI